MKKRLKRAASVFLSVCMMFSLVHISPESLDSVMAAGNGTLQNGELTSSIDGWDSTGTTYGYDFNDGDGLNMWGENAGKFHLSQKVENMAAGNYAVKVSIMTDDKATNPLELTIKNEKSGAEEKIPLIAKTWDENWITNNVISTKSIAVAEGDSVTVTISGDVPAGEWYKFANVVLEASSAVKNAPITVQKVDGLSEDFIHGVDVSTYISEVQSGVKYYDENGNEENLFKILSDSGVNYIRLRLWNCPYAVDENGDYKYVSEDGKTEYKASEVTARKHWIIEPDTSATKDDAFQGAGYNEYFLADGTQVYREGYGAGNCDIENVTEMGKLATYYGMKVLVDFHYSDFWADPKKQSVPKEWKGMSLEEKTTALEKFTGDSIKTMRDAGVDVGMVQIGNEINNGMAGETDADNVYALLKAGSKAIRDIDKNILIAIHYTDPQSESFQYGKASALEYNKVDYDVFASSYYPFWHGSPQTLTTNLKKIADDFHKKVMVAEVSYAWSYDNGDGYTDKVFEGAGDMEFNYPVDVEGQAAAVRDAIAAVSNIGPDGIGTFYWEPAWVPPTEYKEGAANAEEVLASNMKAWRLHGSGWGSIYAKEVDPEIKDDLNGSEWNNQALFDFNGKALPSINVYKWVYTGAEGPTRVSTVDTAEYEMGYKNTPELPETVGVNLNDGSKVDVAVTWDAGEVEKLKTAAFGEYTINGTLGAFSYTNAGDGQTIQVEAGKHKTTCLVTITGKNYVTNSSFEENDGKGSNAPGWKLTNFMEVNDNNNVFIDDPNSANAKSGSWYYTGWAEAGKGIDFKLEQTISEKLTKGYYTLFAYYQGTSVEELKKDSSLYAIVTYQDGSSKTYQAEVKINNVWKDFYQAVVTDIPVTDNVKSVTVGTRVSCAPGKLAPWVVVDDVSLMKQEADALKSFTVTFKDGGAVLSTQTVEHTSAATTPAAPTKAGYTFAGWDKPYTVVHEDMVVNAKWEAGKYNITYDVNGGKKLPAASKTVTYLQTYGELPSPQRAGYTFNGWYTSKTGGTKIAAADKVNITSETTVYAQWKKVSLAKPKKPTVKKASKTSMQVSFKKVKDAQGYRITYSTSKKFTKKTTKSVTTTKLKATIKKLKKNKTYYVKVQAYKKDSTNKNVYGKYSPVRSIKLK